MSTLTISNERLLIVRDCCRFREDKSFWRNCCCCWKNLLKFLKFFDLNWERFWLNVSARSHDFNIDNHRLQNQWSRTVQLILITISLYNDFKIAKQRLSNDCAAIDQHLNENFHLIVHQQWFDNRWSFRTCYTVKFARD